MIISRTPFRISFFGGGTDFPGYYREHGGAVLVTTIDKYAYLLVHRLGPFFNYKYHVNYAKTESVVHPSEIQHPLVRECLEFLPPGDGIEIAHVADLPGRTGLGSSSSFTVGLLNALHTLRGEEADAEDLAQQAIHIERERVGDPGGHQDQYAAAYGGFLRIDFGPGPAVKVRKLGIPSHRLHELQQHLMLLYTGVEQSASGILEEQSASIGQNIESLRQMHRMVDLAEGMLCGKSPLRELGELLHETWERKRRLAGGISNRLIDRAYDSARSAGAWGGKLLGAGGRGFLLLCAPPSAHAAIRAALPQMMEVGFRFGSRGSEVILQTGDIDEVT